MARPYVLNIRARFITLHLELMKEKIFTETSRIKSGFFVSKLGISEIRSEESRLAGINGYT